MRTGRETRRRNEPSHSIFDSAVRRGCIAGGATGTLVGIALGVAIGLDLQTHSAVDAVVDWLVLLVPTGFVIGTLLGITIGVAVGLILRPFSRRIVHMPLAAASATFVVLLIATVAWMVSNDVPFSRPDELNTYDAVIVAIPSAAAIIAALSAVGVNWKR